MVAVASTNTVAPGPRVLMLTTLPVLVLVLLVGTPALDPPVPGRGTVITKGIAPATNKHLSMLPVAPVLAGVILGTRGMGVVVW